MLNLRDIFTTGRLKDSAFVGIILGDHNQNDGVNFSRNIMVINVATNPAAAETIVVGYGTYTFRATPTVAREIKIGNILSNGDFAAGDNGVWGGQNWVVDATGALHTAGTPIATNSFVQSLDQVLNPATIADHSYVLGFTISGCTAGSVVPYIGDTAGTSRNADGVYTADTIVAATTGHLRFVPSADFDGKISAVTVTDAAADLRALTAQAIADMINSDQSQSLCTAYVGYDKVGLTSEVLVVANEIGITPTFTADGVKVVDAIAFTDTLTEAQLETVNYFKKNITSEADVKPTVLVERNAGTDKNFLY
jgi:hypothetical protein